MNPSRLSLLAVALLALLALSGCSGTTAQSAPPLLVDVTTSAASRPAPTPGGPVAAGVRLPELSIARVAASSSLIPLGLNPNKSIEAPPLSEPEQAGLYALGPVPGDPGPAVILGHVNGGGRAGVFARLSELAAGDEVQVRRLDNRVATFRVYRTDTIAKDSFPTRAVYSDTPGPELRLITCGDELDRSAHSYLSNVIVFASLIGVR